MPSSSSLLLASKHTRSFILRGRDPSKSSSRGLLPFFSFVSEMRWNGACSPPTSLPAFPRTPSLPSVAFLQTEAPWA
ncbi:hypothetical protein IE53DRAFT_255181 [Violaceomyces palustris]|uniref:Uncharacterized protein n=1 Tax=Violaceomyces palustris TaxID=1673888 RepID=A0ACD0P3P1_9BASI|nr:hypothetical protein IE53DRAFT_255181 [Violaceomyces palustris]